jgi:hypothetical protein
MKIEYVIGALLIGSYFALTVFGPDWVRMGPYTTYHEIAALKERVDRLEKNGR